MLAPNAEHLYAVAAGGIRQQFRPPRALLGRGFGVAETAVVEGEHALHLRVHQFEQRLAQLAREPSVPVERLAELLVVADQHEAHEQLVEHREQPLVLVELLGQRDTFLRETELCGIRRRPPGREQRCAQRFEQEFAVVGGSGDVDRLLPDRERLVVEPAERERGAEAAQQLRTSARLMFLTERFPQQHHGGRTVSRAPPGGFLHRERGPDQQLVVFEAAGDRGRFLALAYCVGRAGRPGQRVRVLEQQFRAHRAVGRERQHAVEHGDRVVVGEGFDRTAAGAPGVPDRLVRAAERHRGREVARQFGVVGRVAP
ncbi:MAG TPA: hypothetical protein VFG69_15300, partial [Nannocystaceae bacterium]|nr:hypothetical protein [Nannocystaceae bacterium]